MKIRKSVTKGIVFVLVFFSFFLFQGCGNLGKENVDSSNNLIQENSKEVLVSSSHVPNSSTKKENSLLYFSNDVSVVKVLHSNGGGQKSWNMDKRIFHNLGSGYYLCNLNIKILKKVNHLGILMVEMLITFVFPTMRN